MANTPLSRGEVFSQSWPIMLANAAAPLAGLVDTFVIGRFVGAQALAGIGLGAVIFSIAYWAFSFLRMSTTGLAAQAIGSHDEDAVQAHLARAVPLGFGLGWLLILAQIPLIYGAFLIFTGSEAAETSARTYIQARFWGLPAILPSMALMGWFIGLGLSRSALVMQLVVNFINIPLSILFVVSFGWGLHGVGLATSLSEWAGLIAGLGIARHYINKRGGFRPYIFGRKSLLNFAAIRELGVANGNIFIRTAALTIGFSFFGNAAASQGDMFLAGNHILLQFITIIAFVLDSFANVAEARAGAAYGAKNRMQFDRAVRLTSEFSALFAIAAAIFIFVLGPSLIDLMTPDAGVRASAKTYLEFCALVPILGFAAWELDGIFIGVTRTKAMRNASVLALGFYLAAHFMLEPYLGPSGIWIAFLCYYVFRALTLAVYFPAIRAHMKIS